MTPTLSSYLFGAFSITASILALWLGAWWLRRWIVPEFSGALARLAELTLAFVLLTLALQLVGSLGILTPGWMLASCVVIPLIAAGLGYRFAPRDVAQVEAPSVPTWAFLVAVGVASWSVATWSFPSQLSLDQGMFGGDTTWYHMPASARFIQEGSIIPLHFTDPLRLAVWFYPLNGELLHGALMGLMKSDWLSPLLNMVPLAIGLLACWCVGRPYGVGPATLVGGAILLTSGVMIETQPGEGRNDIICFAFLIAFAAFLVNGHQRLAPTSGEVDEKPDPDAPLLDRGPLILAGLAAGLAISIKVSMLAPVGMIFLGMILISGRARWLTTTIWLGGSMFVAGGYWYVRSMLYSGGNPVPAIGWGPLKLPQPDQMPLDPRPRFSVAHYLGDAWIYKWWFFPRLEDAFGLLFPLILVMLAAAAIWLVFRSRNRVVRVLAFAALVTAVVYLFTPLTAAGQEGQPRGFFTNTRYLLPGLLLAMVLLPLIRQLRVPGARARKVLIFLTVVFGITVVSSPKWYPSYLLGAIFLTFVLVWAPVGLTWLRDRGRAPIGMMVGVIAAIVIAAAAWGRSEEVGYAKKHYTRSTLFLQEGGPQKAYDFTRNMRNKRIALAGSGEIFFGQYGFYGIDRTNYVQYLGKEGPNGTYRLFTECRAFINELNRGNFDYLITSERTQDSPDAEYNYPVRAWVKDDPAVTEVVAEPDITPQADYVYRIDGKLDPDYCDRVNEDEEEDRSRFRLDSAPDPGAPERKPSGTAGTTGATGATGETAPAGSGSSTG